VGLKNTFALGLLIFAAAYGGMAVDGGWLVVWFLFFLYRDLCCLHRKYAKAWITNISHESDAATAIGTYTAFQSICTLFDQHPGRVDLVYVGRSLAILDHGIWLYLPRFILCG